jgi:hypothetical protein
MSHITPTIDDIIVELTGAKVFSKLDLNSGYQQVELSPESRNFTTFTTHVGLRRYKRLIFGISSAAGKFQAIIRFDGLQGVNHISDDIIIYGSSVSGPYSAMDSYVKPFFTPQLCSQP